MSNSKQKYQIYKQKNKYFQKYGIFKNLSFCFPVHDVDLTPKKAQIISTLIHKQHGIVFPCRESEKPEQVDYVLVSTNIKLQIVLEKIQGKIQCKKILNYHFVQNSLNQLKIVDETQYILYDFQKQHQKILINDFYKVQQLAVQSAQSKQNSLQSKAYQPDETKRQQTSVANLVQQKKQQKLTLGIFKSKNYYQLNEFKQSNKDDGLQLMNFSDQTLKSDLKLPHLNPINGDDLQNKVVKVQNEFAEGQNKEILGLNDENSEKEKSLSQNVKRDEIMKPYCKVYFDIENKGKKIKLDHFEDQALPNHINDKFDEDEDEEHLKYCNKSSILPKSNLSLQKFLMFKPSSKIFDFKNNNIILEELNKLLRLYSSQKDVGRIKAYSTAIAVIRNVPIELKNPKQVDNLMGIGQKTKDKIKEIIKTGKVHKLQELNKSQVRVVCGRLCEVWGIGPNKALELYRKGIKTVQQLQKEQKAQQILNSRQRIGLQYYSEFSIRIPRQKITRLFEYFRSIVFRLAKSAQFHLMEVCGSYRRGKATCGDIDIIITRKDGKNENGFILRLVKQLQKQGFLTDHLTHPSHKKDYYSTCYMGVCKFEDQIHHRIDIRYYPLEEYSFALMYFTGSMMFNRSIRHHAGTLGLLLSDLGVVPRVNREGVIWSKPIPICYTENDIFQFLGLPYKSPAERQM